MGPLNELYRTTYLYLLTYNYKVCSLLFGKNSLVFMVLVFTPPGGPTELFLVPASASQLV